MRNLRRRQILAIVFVVLLVFLILHKPLGFTPPRERAGHLAMLCIAHIPGATDISVRGSGSALDQCLHCGATGSGFDSRSGHPHTFGYNKPDNALE